MANNTQKILQNPLVKVFAIILTILIIFSLRESQKKALVSKSNLVISQEYLDELRQKVAQETQSINLLSDDLYKEKIQRNELLKQKDGEIILQVPSKNDQNGSESETKDNTLLEEKNLNWHLWWSLLFKKSLP